MSTTLSCSLNDAIRSLSAALEKETGLKYTGEVPTSYAAVVEALCADRVDVGWLSPLPYVLANRKCGAAMQLVSINTSGANFTLREPRKTFRFTVATTF